MMDLQRVNEYMSQVEESEKKVLPHGKRLKTGLDLGTAFIVLVVLDENDQPVACEKQAASVLRDGVVVDYSGACRIVRELKEKLEQRLGEELIDCAIAMPAGTECSVAYAPVCGRRQRALEVTNILDEPTASQCHLPDFKTAWSWTSAAARPVLRLCRTERSCSIEDEPTGGTHLSPGAGRQLPCILRMRQKQSSRTTASHKEILPVVRPVVREDGDDRQKVRLTPAEIDTIYLCGGTTLPDWNRGNL